jgi:phosphatidylserine/phosphatidylglycerophosphate/cardiolipin synthase-like enzyme
MRRLLALVIAVAAGCGGTGAGGGGDGGADGAPGTADARTDAAPGAHCAPTDPRTAAPTLFVGPTGLEQRMLDFIGGAQSTLDVQMYLFSVGALADAVIAAKDRGVAVRVLLDPDEAGNQTNRSKLLAAGVATRDDPAGFSYAHAKYLVADGARGVIMSANFNAGAMSEERNYGIVDTDPDDLATLEAVFDADWTGATPDLACTRLLVSPVNSQPRTLDLIDGATRTLDVEALYVLDTNVRNAMVAAAGRGVAVRVILSDPASTPDNVAGAQFFQGQGIPVRVITQFDIHAKLMVADDTALIGSENFSVTSLTKNREVSALVVEPAQSAVAKAQFDADWAIATAP